MKLISRILVMLFVVSMLSGYTLSVEAATDWDSIDWKTYDPQDFPGEEINDFCRWMEEDAELSTLFLVHTKMSSEMTQTALCNRYAQTPLTFIETLSHESPELQTIICEVIAHYSYYDRNDAIPKQTAALDSNDLTNSEAKQVLLLIQTLLIKHWGDTLPKTGDPVVFIAAALVLSGAGGAVLLDKRKKEN